MTEIRLDSEELLREIEAIELLLNKIRRMTGRGAAASPSVQGIDLTRIEWKRKGSKPASAGDPWAWTFGYAQDGGYLPESETLVKALEQSGKVEMDGYVMTLSGRDKRLLSRKKLKRGGG